jgi:hypothetical protein
MLYPQMLHIARQGSMGCAAAKVERVIVNAVSNPGR